MTNGVPHTPGPWHVPHLAQDDVGCNCASVLAEDGRMGSIAQITVDNGRAIGDGGNDGPPLEEAKANARLIAAAPELLEALLAVRGYMLDHGSDVYAAPVVERCEVAIAKATGAT